MELAVKEKQFELPAEISNFEELRQALVPKLEFYRTLVVTEDSIKSAKSDRANLNSLKKMIDTERKKIKNRYLNLYKAIENQCTQLISLIDKPINAIDDQLRAFDEKALQDKLKDLDNHFRKENPPDFVKLDDVLPEKWRNKTEKSESLKMQMTEKIFQIKSDFNYLKNIYSGSGLWTAIFKKFAETKSREQALAYAVELERAEKRLNSAVANDKISNIITPETHQTAVTDNSERSQTLSGMFRVICTAGQLKNLRDFMLQQNIKFEVIREEK